MSTVVCSLYYTDVKHPHIGSEIRQSIARFKDSLLLTIQGKFNKVDPSDSSKKVSSKVIEWMEKSNCPQEVMASYKGLHMIFTFSIFLPDLGWLTIWLALRLLSQNKEAVTQRCSVKEVSLEISQNSQETPETCNFIKSETPAQVFSCVFCEIPKNNCPCRTPLVAASANMT